MLLIVIVLLFFMYSLFSAGYVVYSLGVAAAVLLLGAFSMYLGQRNEQRRKASRLISSFTRQHEFIRRPKVAFYQLNQTQVDKMQSLVDAPSRCLPVAQVIDADEGEKRQVIEDNLAMIADLVTLGCLKDSTDEYKGTLANIDKVALEEGLTLRAYRVYTVTEVGHQMFGYCKKLIN
jgi:hypothetical protein